MPRSTLAAIGLSIDDQQSTAIEQLLDLEGIVAPAASGGTAGSYVGQRYWNTAGAAGARLYFCTAAGAAGTATWSAPATGV